MAGIKGPANHLIDEPRLGWLTWVFFLAMLAAPVYLVVVASRGAEISRLPLWVGVLCLPPLVTFLLLPRRYLLREDELVVEGLIYRRSFRLDEIKSVQRESLLRALVSPASLYCTDPLRALRLEFSRRPPVIISPSRPREFLAHLLPQEEKRHED
jgi:hypothetical protein